MSDADRFRDAVPIVDVAAVPQGTVASGRLTPIPASSTALFTGQTGTFLSIDVGQFANAGAAAQYAEVYLVLNSPDPPTELANVAIRDTFRIQNGRGDGPFIIERLPGTITSAHVLSTNASVDLSLIWSLKT